MLYIKGLVPTLLSYTFSISPSSDVRDIYTMTSLDLMAPVLLPLQKPAVLCSAKTEDYLKILIIGLVVSLAFAINYIINVAMYYRQQAGTNEQQLPPRYPTLIPWLDSAISHPLDNENILRAAT
jgi:hypothetical protein